MLVVLLAAVTGLFVATRDSAARGAARPLTMRVTYVAWNGRRRPALLVVPPHYHGQRLPLVIALHGRCQPITAVVHAWGSLPTRYHFAVLCPAGEGGQLPAQPWAAPGDLRDLARLPATVTRRLPWLRLNRRYVYVVGFSMGGTEALDLAAHYPRRLAAVVSIDGVADLAAHYEAVKNTPGHAAVRRALVRALGGTPLTRPLVYRRRSPLTYAAALAHDGLPIQIWWSTRDQTVIDQPSRQSGRLFRAIKAFNPSAPVSQVITAGRHGWAFAQATGLTRVVAFLRPGGRWRLDPDY